MFFHISSATDTSYYIIIIRKIAENENTLLMKKLAQRWFGGTASNEQKI